MMMKIYKNITLTLISVFIIALLANVNVSSIRAEEGSSTGGKTQEEIDAYKEANKKTAEEIEAYKEANKKTAEEIEAYKEANKKTQEEIEAYKEEIKKQKEATIAENKALMEEKKTEAKQSFKENYCESIDDFIDTVTSKLDTHVENTASKQTERLANLESKEIENDQKLEQKRLEWDEKRRVRYSNLMDNATSEEQIAAIEAFEDTVEAAVEDRRTKIDAAVEEYRNAKNELISSGETEQSEMIDEYEVAIETAVANVKASCEGDQDPKEIRNQFMAEIKTAQQAFRSNRTNYGQLTQEMMEINNERKQAFYQIYNEYKGILKDAVAELRAIMEPTPVDKMEMMKSNSPGSTPIIDDPNVDL